MQLINKYFPKLQRISSYCLPRNLLNKSVEELRELQEMGLKIFYVGCETGDSALNKTIFRSDHASNHLVLKGVLGRDKARIISEIDAAIERVFLRAYSG